MTETTQITEPNTESVSQTETSTQLPTDAGHSEDSHLLEETSIEPSSVSLLTNIEDDKIPEIEEETTTLTHPPSPVDGTEDIAPLQD